MKTDTILPNGLTHNSSKTANQETHNSICYKNPKAFSAKPHQTYGEQEYESNPTNGNKEKYMSKTKKIR